MTYPEMPDTTSGRPIPATRDLIAGLPAKSKGFIKINLLAFFPLCLKALFTIILLFLVVSGLFAAGNSESIEIQRISEAVKIDGIIDEKQWKLISPFEMISHWPENGKKGTTHTDIRVGYDDDYLYFAATCFSSQDERQMSNFKRDAWGMNMDQVALILDSYNDNENALIFAVTPTGSRVDVAMFNDASTGEFNLTWDTYWDAQVTQDDDAWYVEMRIPFSSLKFQSINDEVIMGMSVYSYQANGKVMDTYPGISDRWGFWSFAKPSQAQRVRFKNINSNRPLYISPYVLTGLEQKNEINAEVSGFDTKNSGELEAGIDVKYAVSDNLTLDVTVNTDFAQVEADDAQINLTRFSLFFPEKRKFFLERESNFKFGFGGYNQLFYSRRIGIYDNQLVRILGGARLVGRIGKWDIGLMDLQTGRLEEIPTENFGVLRLRRQVFNSNSYVGGMVTSRLAENGYYNIAYGLDGIIRVVGDEYFSYNLAQTVDKDLNKSMSGFDASRLHLTWERRTFEGFGYQFSYDYGGYNYNPGLGFETRNDFSGGSTVFSYGWLPGKRSNVQRIMLKLEGTSYFRNASASLESLELGPKLDITRKKNDEYGGNITVQQENLIDTFKLSDDAFIVPGEYNFVSSGVYYNTPQGKNLRSSFRLDGGGFFDGTRISAEAGPFWNISRYLELSGFYQYNRISFNSRDQLFIAHIARFKILVSLNTKLEVSSYIQYNSASRTSVINFRIRYNPRDGNDFYLVYNENDDLDRYTYDFQAPLATYRTLLVKYVHTFRL
jgi:hypothetical protein